MTSGDAVTGYSVEVLGSLPDALVRELRSRWDGVRAHRGGRGTRIAAPLPDDAALRGLLTFLWDAGLTIVTVTTPRSLSSPEPPRPTGRPAANPTRRRT